MDEEEIGGRLDEEESEAAEEEEQSHSMEVKWWIMEKMDEHSEDCSQRKG